MVKAHFEEAKLRDLSSRDGTGRFRSKPTKFRPENSHYSQSSNHGTLNHKYYVCAKVGHLAKNCPQQGRGRPAKSRGQQQHSGTTSGRGANHVTGELGKTQGKVVSFCKELQAAEVEEAMTGKTTTMHILEPDGSADGLVLGPTLFVEVLLEGQPVKALVDTGSPVTIVSIKCLLVTLEKLRTPG